MLYKPIIFNKGFENDLKDISFPFPAEIHNNIIDPKIGKSGGKRILNLVCECPPFRTENNAIVNRAGEFDLILTHDPELYGKLPNARKMLFGTSWIRPEDRAGTWENKSFGVSFICGSKNKSEGHKLRHKVWARQEEIKIPTKFWSSSRNPIKSNGLVLPKNPSDKRIVFDQQFHIVIENVQAKNYFSEKLIDCFMTKTIPIYWGCPDIQRMFGLYNANNENDIIAFCNSLDAGSYNEHKQVIENNYQIGLQYARPFGVRLQEKIIELLG